MNISKDLFTIQLCNLHHVDELTNLHMCSFGPDEHIPVRLGERFVKAMYSWLVSSGHSFVIGAFAAKRLIGLISVCEQSYTWLMLKACLDEFILSILRKPRLLLDYKLWRRLFRRHNTKNKRAQLIAQYPDVAQITIGLVADEWRGKGVFAALVAEAVQQCKSRGGKAIKVGIYKNNWPSRQAFIKAHWTEIAELETQDTVCYMTFFDEHIIQQLGLFSG
jgi:GNAT superfamily N-acetyltransferase